MTKGDRLKSGSKKMERARIFFGKIGYKVVHEFTTLLANISVVLGIGFAIAELRQSSDLERKRIAVEAVHRTKEFDFLRAIKNLKIAIDNHQDAISTGLVDDFNFVMNVYNNISLLYTSGVADKCILNGALAADLEEFEAILKHFHQDDYRSIYSDLVKKMRALRACDQ